MSENIVAEIITYNPDIEVLRKNICAAIDQVECLLVYDSKFNENINVIGHMIGFKNASRRKKEKK